MTTVGISEVRADEAVLPASIIASTSTGYWEDDATLPVAVAAPPATTPSVMPALRHGYYKLYAVRQTDRTSRVYLQQIATTEDGPQVLSTTELREFSAMKGIVTDIRPENSGGIIREPGLFATVYIRTEADSDADADAWNVTRDELGEVAVEKASE
jgi:hypothetical protein